MTISLGDVLVGEPRTARPEAMKVVSALMRDPNRIHFDPKAVAEAGFGDQVINQGPLSSSYLLQDCVTWFGLASSWRSDFRFRANALAGDVLVSHATVTAVGSEPEELIVTADVRLLNQREDVLIDGVILWKVQNKSL